MNISPKHCWVGLSTIAVVIAFCNISTGNTYVTIISACLVALGITLLFHIPRREIYQNVLQVLKNSRIPITIIFIIAFVSGVWMAGGTLPFMLYFASKICSPEIAIPLCFLTCGVMAWVTGSSFCTIASLGVVMVGITTGYGFPKELAVGAVVSGAILGNRVSPVSDTVNLTVAMCKITVSQHRSAMRRRTIVVATVTTLLYFFLGIQFIEQNPNLSYTTEMQQIILDNFRISPICVFPLLFLAFLSFTHFSTIKGLLICAVISMGTAWWSQDCTISELFSAGIFGYQSSVHEEVIANILSGGGLFSMFNTVGVIIITAVLGGLLTASRIPQTLLNWATGYIKDIRNLDLIAFAASMAVLFVSGNQILAIILLAPDLLSVYNRLERTPIHLAGVFADTTVVSGALIPWGTLCIFVTSTLQVGNEYILYSFFCSITPLIALCILSKARKQKR